MRKIIIALFESLILISVHAKVVGQIKEEGDTTKIVAVHFIPAIPIIEQDKYGQYLNFDIVIENTSGNILDLSTLEMSVMDNSGKLVSRKSLNGNGQAPSILLLGNTILKPGQIKSIFNPFYSFLPYVPINILKYEFFFNYADTQSQIETNKNRLLMDYDESFTVMVKPKTYVPKTTLYLPLKGKVIIWDGHDFYAHHRRYPIGLPTQTDSVITANSNRYAYDFITIGNDGSVFKNTPFKKENWYSFGRSVYAPGTGRLVEVQNNVPDNTFNGNDVESPDVSFDLDPLGMGNHVIIDHGNGEYSIILHLEKGSVNFKVGDSVRVGQQIGTVGFSGDAIFPHVHYTVMNGVKEGENEGVPSCFNAYKLHLGNKIIKVKRGRVDSGDIISSDR